jgi:hypothetical protein
MNKNIDYSKKYLKYKNKYLELKNSSVKKTQLGGVIPDDGTLPTEHFRNILDNININNTDDIFIKADTRLSPYNQYFKDFIPNDTVLLQFITAINNNKHDIHLDLSHFNLNFFSEHKDDSGDMDEEGLLIHERHIYYIKILLETCKIVSLNLNGDIFNDNYIKDEHIHYLKDALIKENNILKNLIISNNHGPITDKYITTTYIEDIFDILISENCKLEYLKLDDYTINTAMINTLMEGISLNNTLLKLSIRNKNSSDFYGDMDYIITYNPNGIFSYLQLNKNLKHIRFNMDNTDDIQREEFIDCLQLNSTLKSLYIYEIELTPTFINLISTNLIYTNITSFGFNNFTGTDININNICIELKNLFQMNIKLTHVELENNKNKFNMKRNFKLLIDSLFKLSNIKTLKLSLANNSKSITLSQLANLINRTFINTLFLSINFNDTDEMDSFFNQITNYNIKLNINSNFLEERLQFNMNEHEKKRQQIKKRALLLPLANSRNKKFVAQEIYQMIFNQIDEFNRENFNGNVPENNYEDY